MNSVLNEITELYKNSIFQIDKDNSNRYKVIVQDGGYKRHYCFSTPIYNMKTRKLLTYRFLNKNEQSFYYASEAEVVISDDVVLTNQLGACRVVLPGDIEERCDFLILKSSCAIFPTLNGIAVKALYPKNQRYSIKLVVEDGETLAVRSNNKSFSLMHTKFKPLISVSTIGAMDKQGRLIGPCKIISEKTGECVYEISFSSDIENLEYILFEINMHESKLLQDTTVESRHPRDNNAFGSVAFLGNTKEFGEQWLYFRPDFNCIPEFYNKKIYKAVLHIPAYNEVDMEIIAIKTAARFCSFGSTWENRIPEKEASVIVQKNGKYISVDITSMITDKIISHIKAVDGIILKCTSKCNEFAAISTGDSCYAPQILEIITN